MSAHASGQPGWRRHAWLVPAVFAAALIALLCCLAWTHGYQQRWLAGPAAWWRSALTTEYGWTPAVAMGLLFTALSGYWWPRRRQQVPIALIAGVVLVVVAALLGLASYIPCRGHVGAAGVLFWVLQMYVGQPPNGIYQSVSTAAACSGAPPPALQLGQVDGLGATLIGVLAVASALWRQPLGRLQSRFARDAIILTGLSPLTLPLLKRLTETARSPRTVIVIEPDEAHPLLEEARLTGARVVIGDPALPHLLSPIICAWRGCALNHLYALRDKVQDNEAIIKAATGILGRYQAHPDRHPHLVALIDDPRHADHWRGTHSGTSGVWFEDALSSAESTARDLVSQVLGTQPRHVLVCGDSTLTVTILLELARRAWEQAEVAKAAATGRAALPARGDGAPAARLAIERVALLDLRAPDIKREYLASAPKAILDSLPAVVAHPVRWRDLLLKTLDAMDSAQARQTAVIITEGPPGAGVHEAGRVARLHPETPVFVLASSGTGMGGAIFDLLHPFEPGLLIEGEVPEDTWTRVARHWHECYRLSHPLPPGHPQSHARLPWPELDPFLKEDNILELRSILSAVAACGRQWAPLHLVPPGSVIELSERDLTSIAIAEHTRWQQRRLAAGRPGEYVVQWAELPDQMRDEIRRHLVSQLTQLEDVGFVPVVPAGGPPGAASYERVGLVRASQLSEPLAWTTHAGEQMHGYAGDWHVVDDKGNMRTVTDPDFQASHEPAEDGRWRRIGVYRAWQVEQPVVIRTKEGKATAQRGDWVVEAPTGERWPVRNEQFGWSYRPVPRRPEPPDQAIAPTAASSSTAPRISS